MCLDFKKYVFALCCRLSNRILTFFVLLKNCFLITNSIGYELEIFKPRKTIIDGQAIKKE